MITKHCWIFERLLGFRSLYVEGMEFGEFENDVKTQSAVLYQIAIVGEAVKRLSMSFRDDYTTIP